MFPVVEHKRKSVAALTARQYRETKKRELESLKMRVDFLQKGYEYYKLMYERSQIELRALRERYSVLEEVVRQSRLCDHGSRPTVGPSVSQSLSPNLDFDCENEPYLDDFFDPIPAHSHVTLFQVLPAGSD